MKTPKQCINTNCNNIIYVEEHNLHLPLQCQSCIDNKDKTERIKYLYIRIMVRDGEREHLHHCLNETKCDNINFAAEWYTSHFWGESTRDDNSWYAWNNEICITLKEVRELTKEKFEYLYDLFYG